MRPGKALAIVVIVIVVVVVLVKLFRQRPSGGTQPPTGYEVMRAPGAWRSAEEVITGCRSMGQSGLADQLDREASLCFRFVPEQSGEPGDGAAAYATRIGGKPDLPDPTLWPQHQGRSLSFVGQVNLAEIPPGTDHAGLPGSGMLYYFYEVDQTAWGFDPKDKGAWRVIYAENLPADPPTLDFPPDLPDEARYAGIRMQLQESLSIPEPMGMIDRAELTDKEQDVLYDLYGRYSEYGPPKHQLLGHPMPIQGGDMDVECQLVSHGLYCGDPSGYKDPRAEVLKADAKDWRLLLQVDSDDDAGMMWGDAGRLYFWIREEDLRARRFDQVWMILQCF